MQYAILKEDHSIVPASLGEWSKFFAVPEKRTVARDYFEGGVRVSTIFLGLNHQWDEKKPPLWFETMIFGGPHDGYQARYATWEQAEAAHKRVVANLQAGKDPDAED